MRGRVPTLNDLKRTLLGCLQSTAFLTTSAFSYCLFLCIIRNTWGSYNFWTFSYVPAFMSSVCALSIERPSRRGLLCLYVSNVATETLFRIAVARGLVTPIKYGQVLIFGISSALMMYYFRKGAHNRHKDSIFDILRYVIGKNEEEISQRPQEAALEAAERQRIHEQRRSLYEQQRQVAAPLPAQQHRQRQRQRHQQKYNLILKCVQIYVDIIKTVKKMKKHSTCPHNYSCLHYVLQNGFKLFTIGLGVQISLRLFLNMKRIVASGPKTLLNVIFSRDSLKLGIFLGGFSSIFRVSYQI